MNVAILGVAEPSLIMADLIEKFYNPWIEQRLGEPLNVTAFVTWEENVPFQINDIAVLNPIQLAALYRKKVIRKIILPREVYTWQNKMLDDLQLLNLKLDDVYICARLAESMNFLDFVEPYYSAKYLPYLEFHVADHCNMNCKACEHYSALVKEPRFTDLEKFTRDFEQLHKFIDDIGRIRILGGEPLLNPEINEYVKLSHRLYPQSVIRVVTNALLLPKMSEDFFETLRQNNVGIDISFYPPAQSKIEQIPKLLTEKKVEFSVSPLLETFTIKQTLNPHNNAREIFLKCFQASCRNLYDGKIAACFLPFTTKYFNAYYKKNLPEDGALDLYEKDLTTEKLKKFLSLPFERCRYCTQPISVEWGTVSHPSPITDWTNDHLAKN